MALMVPGSIPSKASQGEKTLYSILRDCLPDDFLVWYEPQIEGLLPDFVILSPTFGLLVLEVKGWSAAQIVQADGYFFKVQENKKGVERLESHKSPLRQGRDYFSSIMDKFKQYPVLTQAEGRHQGKLLFPVGVGAVMPNMTSAQSQEASILPILPQPQVAYRDELLEWMNFGERELIQRLKEMFTTHFSFMALTNDQISTIKGILHPETVVREKPATAESVPTGVELPQNTSVIVTLDVRQEQLARNLGDGHRVIAGVAGSGKTLVLLARAKFLADRHPNHRILVICFNITLAASLRSLLERDTKNPHYHTQIKVIHFNDWAKSLLGRLPVPTERLRGEAYDEYLGEQVLKVLSQTSLDRKWDAVLIDEAHTFHPNWFRCCISALKNPEDGDLLIVCDANQRLIKRGNFTWKSVGVKAQGRRTIKLTENYRNTQEILAAAWSVLSLLPNEQVQDDAEQTFPTIEPSTALRHGEIPVLHRTNNKTHAVNAVLRHISSLMQKSYFPEDIAILYQRNQNYDSLFERLLNKLDEMGIGAYWVTENDEAKRNYGSHLPGIRLITAKSSLGLEFKAVLILWLEQFDGCYASTDAAESARLCRELYVAMTRAQESLFLLGRNDSRIVIELQDSPHFKAIGNLASPPISTVNFDPDKEVPSERYKKLHDEPIDELLAQGHDIDALVRAGILKGTNYLEEARISQEIMRSAKEEGDALIARFEDDGSPPPKP